MPLGTPQGVYPRPRPQDRLVIRLPDPLRVLELEIHKEALITGYFLLLIGVLMAGITQVERERRNRLYERGLKQCTTCDEPLPLAAFAARHDGYQGLNGTCRDCKNEATRDYQRRTPELQAVRQSRWRVGNRDQWLAISRRRAVRLRWRREGVTV
jgi:hypothetical protein